MDLRLAAEALARLNLGAPIRPRARAASRLACQCRQLHLPATPYRQRTSTAGWAQRRGLSASSTTRSAPAGAEGAKPDSPTSRHPRRGREMPSDDEIASIVDQSFQPGRSAAPRTSRFGSPFGQRVNRDPSINTPPWKLANSASERTNEQGERRGWQNRQVRKTRGAVDLLEDAMRQDPLTSGLGPGQHQSSAGFLDNFVTGATKPGGEKDFNVDDVVDDALGLTSRRAAVAKPLPKSSLRLGSSVGRTIEMNPARGIDLSRGITMLEMRLSSNRVRSDYHKQKFHERPGLKRKRLASTRWRNKFKLGFQHVVKRVQYLKKMGW